MAALGTALLLGSCGEGPAPAADDHRAALDSGPSGTLPGSQCSGPEEGCPCEPGTDPVSCFAEPVSTDEGMQCAEGTRYCRDGTWSECESARTFMLEESTGALRSGPTICNPCNPNCVTETDQPTDADLTQDNSSDVTYDPAKGGVTIEELMNPPGPTDTDGDGIPDASDDCPNTNPGGPDTDGDGIPDEAEQYDPTHSNAPRFGCPGGSSEGFYHTLPRGGPSKFDPIDFTTQVTTADVYLLIDDSGSMSGEMSNLKNQLRNGTLLSGCSGGLIGAIKCTIPDAWIGLGSFEEYSVSPYGDSDNTIYQHWQDLTPSASDVDSAVGNLTPHGNFSTPEGATQALWATSTGNGLDGYETNHDTTSCGADEWGFPCFRADTIPIVVLVTDAPFHNGPPVGGRHRYDVGDFCSTCTQWTCTDCAECDGLWEPGGTQGNWQCDGGKVTCDACGGDTSPDPDSPWQCSGTATCTNCGGDPSPDTNPWQCSGTVSNCRWTFSGYLCDCDGGEWSCPAGQCYEGTCSTGWSCGGNCTDYDCSGSWSCGGTCTACNDWDCQSCQGWEPITWSESLNALNQEGMRVITVESSGGSYAGGEALDDGKALANQTNTVDGSGSPFVYSIATDGSGLSGNIATAIQELANFTRFDVSARPVDNPSTGSVDEREFVEGIRVQGWGPGDCQGTSSGTRSWPGGSADTADQCTPGTVVDFKTEFRNDFVNQTSTSQAFEFDIEVLLDGSVQETIPVEIVVPPESPQYLTLGSYSRDYDATKVCATDPLFCDTTTCPTNTCTRDPDGDGNQEYDQNVCAGCSTDADCGSEGVCGADGVCFNLDNIQRPDWGDFTWDADTPQDSTIEFEIRTADSQSGLDSATPASFTVDTQQPDTCSSGSCAVDIGGLLESNGLNNGRPWLRVTATLGASSDQQDTPVLHEFKTQYTCVNRL